MTNVSKIFFKNKLNLTVMFRNLKELISSMPDDQTCRQYLIKQRWPDGIRCPYCGCGKIYNLKGGRRYKCAEKTCYQIFTATVGTIMEDSNLPLDKWFMAIFILTGHKKGISSCQLARDIGVTQKTAWFMNHRIREMMRMKAPKKLNNTVEIDETYIGGRVGNMHNHKRKELRDKNISTSSELKTGVMGFLERDGELKFVCIGNMVDQFHLQSYVRKNVNFESVIVTDSSKAYAGLVNEYAGHEIVNHAQHEYVRGKFYTNSIEGAFSLLKRGFIGIYHQWSKKHVSRYCDEFEYRYNSRKIKDVDRFTLSLSKLEGRLDYYKLTGKDRPLPNL